MPLDEITMALRRLAVSSFGLLWRGDRLKARRREHRDILLRWLHVGIEFTHARRVVPERLRGHGTVDVDRHHRDALLAFQATDPVQQLFHPPNRKRRNDQLASPGRGVVNDLCELGAVVVLLMIAIAVRRLDQHDVRPNGRKRIRQHRTAVSSEVSAKKNRRTTLQTHDDERRTEQVTSRHEFHRDAWRHVDRPLVSHRLQHA